jgi:hypothetical protein
MIATQDERFSEGNRQMMIVGKRANGTFETRWQ